MDRMVDFDGYMKSTFLPHFRVMDNEDWTGAVRTAMCGLLHMVDETINKPNSQTFRGVCDVQQDAPNTDAQHAVLGVCFAINEYKHLRSMRHCEPDAEAMAAEFTCQEHNSHGIAVTANNGCSISGKRDIEKCLKSLVFPLFSSSIVSLQTMVMYFACHGL
jgi:hypothetical protein